MALGAHDIRTARRSEIDADGMMGVQCDAFGKNAGGPAVEMHHPFGFLSVPGDPDEDGVGCQVHTAEEGSRQHAWLSYDARALALLPPGVKVPRSVAQYSYYGGFDVFTATDGSKQVYVPFARGADGVPTKAHVFEMKVNGGCTLRHASGAGIALTETSAILNSPDGSTSLELLNNGEMILNGNLRVTGTIGQGPAPSLPVSTGIGAASIANKNVLLTPV